MEKKKTIYLAQAEEIIKNLKRRNMDGIYFENSNQAVASILKMIPDDSLVGLGGSESILESGLVDALRKKKIRLLDRYKEGVTKEEVWEMRKQGLLADVYIASSNAITIDGKLVNMDGIGNRVAAMIFGPEKVILLVGMNKVVNTVEEAVSRIKNYTAPLNAVRINIMTPCYKKGCCQEPYCTPPHRICSQLVILEASMIPGRLTVVLVGEELGF
ncbi:MAG: lactate utilization protein [Candidatus Aminicenantales bacterium]